jgi:hypothetical protein
MRRIVVTLAVIGLVGLLATAASANTPAVASLSVQAAATSVGGHPYGHWHGPYGHHPHWYPGPRVAVVPYAYVPPPAPVYVAPAVPYYPYACPPRASVFYGSPRWSVGFSF